MKTSTIKSYLDAAPYLEVPGGLLIHLESADSIPWINGTGSLDSKTLTAFTPNIVEGVDITAAAIIHDYQYYKATTLREKYLADNEFDSNCIIIIIHQVDDEVIANKDLMGYRFTLVDMMTLFIIEYSLKHFDDKTDSHTDDRTNLQRGLCIAKLVFSVLTLPLSILGRGFAILTGMTKKHKF